MKKIQIDRTSQCSPSGIMEQNATRFNQIPTQFWKYVAVLSHRLMQFSGQTTCGAMHLRSDKYISKMGTSHILGHFSALHLGLL